MHIVSNKKQEELWSTFVFFAHCSCLKFPKPMQNDKFIPHNTKSDDSEMTVEHCYDKPIGMHRMIREHPL